MKGRSYSARALAIHVVREAGRRFDDVVLDSALRKSRAAAIRLGRRAVALGIPGFIRYMSASQNCRVAVSVFGRRLTLRKGTPDLDVAMSNLGQEFDGLENYLPAAFDGVIVDGGGYVGTAAIKFAEKFPLARIITLEPEASNFEMLLLNTATYPSIQPVRGALVGTERERVRLHDSGCGEWGFTISDSAANGTSHGFTGDAPAFTLRQLKLSNIGLLKLDVEGAEKEIFESDDPLLHSVPVVLAELHDHLVPGCTSAFRSFSRERTITFDGVEKWYSTIRS